MFFSKKKNNGKSIIKNLNIPSDFENFIKEHYVIQQIANDIISEKTAVAPVKMENFMVQENLHRQFKNRFFTTNSLDSFIADFYKDKLNEDCKLGTTFYYIYYGFDFYKPSELKKIASNFLPDMKLLPFAIHGHDSKDGVLCLDYRINENDPSILYINTKTGIMITAMDTYKEFIK